MAIYYVYSGAGGTNNGSSWANAFTTLTTAFATEVAGDTLYVAHDHAESTAAAVTLTSSGILANPTKVICVNRAGSVPPVAADRRATAQVSTTGANTLTITGCTHYDGIIFTAGSGASAAHLVVGNTASMWLRFDNCSLRNGINAAGAAIYFGGVAASLGATYAELNNTTMSFANAASTVNFIGIMKWRNTPSALLGTIPTVLFTGTTVRGGSLECIGVDFSAAGSGKTIATVAGAYQAFKYMFVDCKLDAAVTKSNIASGGAAMGAAEIDFVRSSATGNSAIYRDRTGGTLVEETTIVRTGGASDGTTPIAWKIATTANCFYSIPFECPPIAIWNDTTGSARTATIEGIWGGGAVPNDDEVWVDVEYLGDASSPQASFVNDGKPDLITSAAAQTSSSETWGGSTTKFKLSVTFTPQMKGWLYGRVKVGKASATVYIDPLITLT